MSHPLDGADLRVRRADQHLDELKELVAEFISEEYQGSTVHAGPNPDGSAGWIVGKPGNPVPAMTPILVGEIVYNLRAALDYLVYELALKDSGAIQKFTQFPVYDTLNDFRARVNRDLTGVDAAHVALIERLQPYNGVNWTKTLQTLSNPDKHRHLTVTHSGGELTVTSSENAADLIDPSDGGIAIRTTMHLDGFEPVHVQSHITLLVTFDDGAPIIEALEALVTEVTQALTRFRPEF